MCAHMEDGHRCAIGMRVIITGVRLVSVWCGTEADNSKNNVKSLEFLCCFEINSLNAVIWVTLGVLA